MSTAPKWSDEDIDLVSAMWKGGMTATEISAALRGRFSRGAILGQMSRQGIYRTKPHVPPKKKPKIVKRKEKKKPQVYEQLYHVHPMWSMDEDDRRQAFIDKFNEGWIGVQDRLNAGR